MKLLEVELKLLKCSRRKGSKTVSFPLRAPDVNMVFLNVYIFRPEGNRFNRAQAGGADQAQKRPVLGVHDGADPDEEIGRVARMGSGAKVEAPSVYLPIEELQGSRQAAPLPVVHGFRPLAVKEVAADVGFGQLAGMARIKIRGE